MKKLDFYRLVYKYLLEEADYCNVLKTSVLYVRFMQNERYGFIAFTQFLNLMGYDTSVNLNKPDEDLHEIAHEISSVLVSDALLRKSIYAN